MLFSHYFFFFIGFCFSFFSCYQTSNEKKQNATNEKTFFKVLRIYILHYYEKCELINISHISLLSKTTFNYIDKNDVCVALVGFRIQNKLLNGYVSRLLLARHLTALRNHPHLTRAILGGLGSFEPEKLFKSKKYLGSGLGAPHGEPLVLKMCPGWLKNNIWVFRPPF